jgi:cysteinyl-tRNA synthetase
MAGVAAVVDRIEDDLDLPGALVALEVLAADESVSPGARFEAFAHLDRLLGLDLAAEVGRR